MEIYKEKKTKPKASRKNIRKIRSEINGMKIKQTWSTNKTKVCSLKGQHN